MSTEIKNTLFRFVTNRPPQLSDDIGKEKRFVFRNEKLEKGFFENAVTIKTRETKWDAMVLASDNFDCFKTETDLKNQNTEIYNFAIWLARNKSDFTNTDLNTRISTLKTLKPSVDLNKLWDNLFYQVITQKNFYLKESISHILVACNLLENFQVRNSAATQDLINAKIVLPANLFVEDKDATNISSAKAISKTETYKTSTSFPNEFMKKQQAISLAQLKTQKTNALKKELAILSKSFQKEYQNEFAIANANYQKEIKPILDTYTQETQETKENWCSVRDPKIPYDPADPCNTPPVVPMPDLPKFEFDFRNPLDINELRNQLTSESLTTLYDVLGISHNVEFKTKEITPNIQTEFDPLSGYDTFDDLTSQLDFNITIYDQIVFDNSAFNFIPSVFMGGVLIPIFIPTGGAAFSFQICPKNLPFGQINFDLTFFVPDDSWEFVGMTYTLKKTSGDYTDSVTTWTGDLNSIFLTNLATVFVWQETDVTGFEGEITFSNGIKKSISVDKFNFKTCFSGQLSDVRVPTNPGTSIPTKSTPPFIPSGFGVKQIGIADYKKVEQSVQCYIEGEVANIENIMAREHRSKSTRRLRRSENTETSSTDSEKEQITDTSTTDRFEMHSEVAKVLQESQDVNAATQYTISGGALGNGYSFGANLGFASHTSKEENTRQAITQAKEVTAKASERISTKIHQERIVKIVEEFEENNLHEFDNRKGDKHVVGVYRWVDKVYKNQIVNYGKRLMYEFMIPEPSKLHNLGMQENQALVNAIEIPVDPRKSGKLTLVDFTSVGDNAQTKFWCSKYNVDIKEKLSDTISVGKSIDMFDVTTNQAHSKSESILIPENYETKTAQADYSCAAPGKSTGWGKNMFLTMGNYSTYFGQYPTTNSTGLIAVNTFKGSFPVSIGYTNFHVLTINFNVTCGLTLEYQNQWKQKTFKAIIDAYETALENYNQKIEAENEKGAKIKNTNPGFYRQIENMVLRKNCISYIIDQTKSAKNTYGKSMNNGSNKFNEFEITVNKDLDDYASFAKFIEQAFEWEIMSYNFYPYYWGNRDNWAQLYQYDNNDPLFRNFMQSGMARVIVTVRPGFEEAVRFYMQTGQIWNGGAVPVIEDKLFMSIVDELRAPTGQKEGKAWVTRLPTSLTILQANSIGLEVEKALPCNCDDVNTINFEDPTQVPCNSNFLLTTAQMSATTPTHSGKLIGVVRENFETLLKIQLNDLDGNQVAATICNAQGEWELNQILEGKYELYIDSSELLPEKNYTVVEGKKKQFVTVENDQILQIDLTLKKM